MISKKALVGADVLASMLMMSSSVMAQTVGFCAEAGDRERALPTPDLPYRVGDRIRDCRV